MAEELKLKGLKRQEVADLPPETALRRRPTQGVSNLPTSEQEILTHKSKNETNMSPAADTSLALNGSFHLDVLDRKVKSMMTFSENVIDSKKGRARICKECGREGQVTDIMRHIEANHISGLSIPCDHCEKTLSTRDALRQHVRKLHSQSVTFGQ